MKNPASNESKNVVEGVERVEVVSSVAKNRNMDEMAKIDENKENKSAPSTQHFVDVEGVVDIQLMFDDDDIVEFHPNSRITEKTILSDGNVDVLGCFSIFTSDGSKPLLTGSSLAEKLNGREDPFAKRGGIENPGNLLFASYLWDVVLQTQFLEDKTPSACVEKDCKTFIPEMKEYLKEIEFSAFGEYVNWVNAKDPENDGKLNITNSTCNWFDVPAILRTVAPTYNNLVETEYNPLRYYTQSVIKGLPHSVIMMPWYEYKLQKLIPGVENGYEVSKNRIIIVVYVILANSAVESFCVMCCTEFGAPNNRKLLVLYILSTECA